MYLISQDPYPAFFPLPCPLPYLLPNISPLALYKLPCASCSMSGNSHPLFSIPSVTLFNNTVKWNTLCTTVYGVHVMHHLSWAAQPFPNPLTVWLFNCSQKLTKTILCYSFIKAAHTAAGLTTFNSLVHLKSKKTEQRHVHTTILNYECTREERDD